jgi:hypothetical protein
MGRTRLALILGIASLAIAALPASSSADICPTGTIHLGGDIITQAGCFYPTVNVSANPSTIQQGQSSTVSFSISGGDPAQGCYKTGGWSGGIGLSGSGAASGSQGVSPSLTTDYGVTCPASPNPGNGTATVTVTPAGPPPPPPPPPPNTCPPEQCLDWYTEGNDSSNLSFSSPQGCSNVEAVKTGKSFLFRTVVFKVHLKVNWCWQRPAITSLVATCWTDSLSTLTIQASNCALQNTYYNWGGSPKGGHLSFGVTTINGCVFKYGCYKSDKVNLRVWVNGNGASAKATS